MVGSHPGLRAGSWRKLGTCPRPAAGFIGGLDIPTPNHAPSGSRNSNLFKVSGAGQARSGLGAWASAAGIPEPPETWAVASAFFLASNWLEGPSFRRAESAHRGGQWTATLVARRMETARARAVSRSSRLQTAPEQGLPTATAPTQSLLSWGSQHGCPSTRPPDDDTSQPTCSPWLRGHRSSPHPR